MNLQTYLIYGVLGVLTLAFANCSGETSSGSNAPLKATSDMEIFYRTSSLVPRGTSNNEVTVKDKSLTVLDGKSVYNPKTAKLEEKKPSKWSREISDQEKDDLFRAFTENKFFEIEVDDDAPFSHHPIFETISIRVGKTTK